MRILAEAKVVTPDKSVAGYHFPGRIEDIAPGTACLRVEITCQKLKGDAVRLLVVQQELTAANPIRRVEAKEVKMGDKFQLAQIPFGNGMIWVEVIAREFKR